MPNVKGSARLGGNKGGGTMSEIKRKQYPIPEELDDLFFMAEVLAGLRNRFMKMPFGVKKAIKCAVQSERKLEKFWDKVYKAYPHLKGKTIAYRRIDRVVIVIKPTVE